MRCPAFVPDTEFCSCPYSQDTSKGEKCMRGLITDNLRRPQHSITESAIPRVMDSAERVDVQLA